METNTHFLSYIAQFLLEWEMFQKRNCTENQNTQFMFNNLFLKKLRSLWDKAENIIESDRP
jgi:hypothetical protein